MNEVIGVSVASEQSLTDIADLVTDLRDASRNSSVAILIGGCMFSADPELAVRVGADRTALDAEGAMMPQENQGRRRDGLGRREN